MGAKEFGDLVGRRMDELGISQRRLASKIGELPDGRIFDATQIRLIREGRRRLDRVLVQKLIDLFDMMVLLGYWQGLRVGEIARLRVEDVSLMLVEPQMLIHGKCGKDVWVDVADGLVGPLRAYLATRPRRGPLIPNLNDPTRHLDENYAACLLAAAMRPIVGDSGHALRHTHGNLLRRLTKDPYVVRDALRHSSIAMQDVYIDANHELLRAARAQLPDPLKEAR